MREPWCVAAGLVAASLTLIAPAQAQVQDVRFERVAEGVAGKVPTLPERWIAGTDEQLDLGGTTDQADQRRAAAVPLALVHHGLVVLELGSQSATAKFTVTASRPRQRRQVSSSWVGFSQAWAKDKRAWGR